MNKTSKAMQRRQSAEERSRIWRNWSRMAPERIFVTLTMFTVNDLMERLLTDRLDAQDFRTLSYWLIGGLVTCEEVETESERLRLCGLKVFAEIDHNPGAFAHNGLRNAFACFPNCFDAIAYKLMDLGFAGKEPEDCERVINRMRQLFNMPQQKTLFE